MPKPVRNHDNEFEFLICDIANYWRKSLSSHLKTIDISIAEWRVLYAVSRFPGNTQVQIAEWIELEPQSLTRILDSLEKKHWIEKRPSSVDRRAKCLFPTQESCKILEKVREFGDQVIRPVALKNINVDNQNVLKSLLEQVKHNFLEHSD